MGDGLKRAFAAARATQMHRQGEVMPDRGDHLHWLKCTDCGREWAEKDSGAFAKGSRVCQPEKRKT
jgi:hypothetical protein